MSACTSCGTEIPSDATFCPACGATAAGAGAPPPAASSAGPVATAGDAGGLLTVGTIGAYTMVLVSILAIVRQFGGMRSQALVIVLAILGLGGLIGLGVGLLGHKKASGNGLAGTAAVALFIAAVLALTPLIAFAARSRGLMYIVVYGLPIVSLVAWSLTGVVGLQSKQWFGDGVGSVVGWTLIASAVWELIAMLVLVSGGIRSMGALKTIQIVSLLFTLARAGGLVALAMGFQKLRSASAG